MTEDEDFDLPDEEFSFVTLFAAWVIWKGLCNELSLTLYAIYSHIIAIAIAFLCSLHSNNTRNKITYTILWITLSLSDLNYK